MAVKRQGGGTILTRKAQRKQARQQKKANNARYYQIKHNRNNPVIQGKTDSKPTTKKVIVPKTVKAVEESDEEIMSEDCSAVDMSSSEESIQLSEDCSDPIMAFAEEALDNGLYDSDGNIDDDLYESRYGTKFSDDASEDVSDDENISEQEEFDEDMNDETYDMGPESDIESEPKPRVPEAVKNEAVYKIIKGFLNRLSMSNFESIACSVERLYLEHARKVVNEAIIDLILSAITAQADLLDSYLLVFACFCATLGHLTGVEFAAFIVEQVVQEYLRIRASQEQRVSLNLITFLSFLYDLQVVSNKIIEDLTCESIRALGEIDVEIILKLIRTCGAQLRRDNPASVKTIILTLNEKVMGLDSQSQSSRFKFMLESIYDLKNNKQRGVLAFGAELESAKKLLRNMAQQRMISKMEPLRFGLDDIRDAQKKGKWWLIGGTWKDTTKSETRKSVPAAEQDQVTKLLKEQKMNTDLRKAIFSALAASEDCDDAFQRLLNLKLNSKQDRDLISIILHCCGQEKVYNPFYALLAARLISFKHNHLMTLKYAFSDWMEQVDDYPIRKLANISRFYAYLIARKSITLSVVKRVNFLKLSEKTTLFLQLLFSLVASELSLDDLALAFKGLSEQSKNDSAESVGLLKSSVKLFLGHSLGLREIKALSFVPSPDEVHQKLRSCASLL